MVPVLMSPQAHDDTAAGVAAGPTSDDLLDARFAAGEDGAFRDAYDRYGSLVFTFCRRTLGPTDAADATQETFVSAWRSRHRYEPGRASVGGWLMGIARFKVLGVLRQSGRTPVPVDPAGRPDSAVTDVDGIIDRMLLADALAQLPARMRAVVELAFYQGLTHEEIAQQAELPLGTVKSDVRRGLERLRRHVQHGKEDVDG